jgi:hypothetical protein
MLTLFADDTVEMKEPFLDLQTLTQQTAALSDMELQSYLQSLSSSQTTALTSQQITNVMNEVMTAKGSQYKNYSTQTTGADNNITAALYYVSRTQDLANLANDVDTVTAKQLTAAQINSGLSVRQNEINEWSNFNKIDTLFFMQLLFIILTFVSILVFLKSNDIISPMSFKVLTGLCFIVAVLVLINRARYTNVARNPRYWHKIRFPREVNPYPTVSSTCPGSS